MGLAANLPATGQLRSERSGVAIVEFAMIAPVLIVFAVGILEMSLRFRAGEEATRYVHQVADLVGREHAVTSSDITTLFNASVYMMKPVDTTSALDLHVRSVGFPKHSHQSPFLLWERSKGSPIDFDFATAQGLGEDGDSVIHVGVRFHYDSPLSAMFGGSAMAIERSALVRPRAVRLISIDGHESEA